MGGRLPLHLLRLRRDGARVSLVDGGHTNAIAGQSFTIQVASFYNPDPTLVPLFATLDWGDESGGNVPFVSDGNNDGGFLAESQHTYFWPGNYYIPVDICSYNRFSPVETVYATVSVSDAAVSITPATVFGLENTPLSVPPAPLTTVATFAAAGQDLPDAFLALITWEPGHTSAGMVGYDSSNACYTISGDYTYEQTGWYAVTVQLYDAGGNQFTATSTVNVNDGALTPTPVELPIDNLIEGGMLKVAHFTDADPAAVSSDYAAAIDWGDGDPSTSCQVVPVDPAAGGGFDVYALKSTAYAGSNGAITVTISDSDDTYDNSSLAVSNDVLLLDNGSTVALDGLPAGCGLNISNGTTLDLQQNSVAVGSVMLIDGSITDGSITAGSYTVESGSIAADWPAGRLDDDAAPTRCSYGQ